MTQRPELEPDALIALAEEVYRPALAEAYGDDDPPIDISVTTSDDEAFITDEQDGEILLAVRRCKHGAEVLYRALLEVGRRESPDVTKHKKHVLDLANQNTVLNELLDTAIGELVRAGKGDAASKFREAQKNAWAIGRDDAEPGAVH